MKGYFNSVGFERWNKIYGTTDEISTVSSATPNMWPRLWSRAGSRLHGPDPVTRDCSSMGQLSARLLCHAGIIN